MTFSFDSYRSATPRDWGLLERWRHVLIGMVLTAALGGAPGQALAVGPQGLKPPSLDPRDLSGVWWSQSSDDGAHAVEGKIPFTPAGRKTYLETVAGLTSGEVDDAVRSRCVLPGAVRTMAAPYPIQILQVAGEVVLLPEGWHAYREVFLDAPHTKPEDISPSFTGESVGRWTGDTLIVDTVGVKDGVWLDGSGLPHSDQLHIVEHIRKLASGTQLEDRITIIDPKIYARPWTIRHVYEWRPDVRLAEFVCGDRKRDTIGGTRLPKLPPPVPSRPAPPAPSGSVDLSGVWHHVAKPGSGEFRRAFTTTTDGQPPPMQPWAQANYERFKKAVADGHPLATLATRCLPFGLPAFWSQPYPYRVVQTADYLVVLSEADHQFRIVYLNAEHPKIYETSWYGDSIGHWVGDTLVIETVGQNERTLFSPSGIPKTDALLLTERLRLKDGGKGLDDQMTVDDPGAFTKSWETVWPLSRMEPTDRLQEYVCAENERDVARFTAGRRPAAAAPAPAPAGAH